MKIALLGYGKMGKEIEHLALKKNHQIILRVDSKNADKVSSEELSHADIGIEFSTPGAAIGLIEKCLEANISVVCGTTGWTDKLEAVKSEFRNKNLGLFYSSNYSIGMNMFMELNRNLADMMENFPEYRPVMHEAHHIKKLDSPSGTAITIAEEILRKVTRYKSWKNFISKTDPKEISLSENEIAIHSIREGNIIGTHSVGYRSYSDLIEIRHEALNREAFAQGALMAAEWMTGKKGIFEMKDLLAK